ncbi:hypothetical protein, partial [Paraburkholderia sp. SIMBA_053]|uniref:hypothetical protein n=1 Tax=Paraburkholderia sp. SIMBA_053 TaxID=3085794 RepID=UPI00397B72D4
LAGVSANDVDARHRVFREVRNWLTSDGYSYRIGARAAVCVASYGPNELHVSSGRGRVLAD